MTGQKARGGRLFLCPIRTLLLTEPLPGVEGPADGGVVPEDRELVPGPEDRVGAGGLGLLWRHRLDRTGGDLLAPVATDVNEALQGLTTRRLT